MENEGKTGEEREEGRRRGEALGQQLSEWARPPENRLLVIVLLFLGGLVYLRVSLLGSSSGSQ